MADEKYYRINGINSDLFPNVFNEQHFLAYLKGWVKGSVGKRLLIEIVPELE